MFDSSSTRSFISFIFVNQAYIEVEPLTYELLVSISSKVILLTSEKLKVGKMVVFDQPLDVLLIILDMYDYENIRSIYWLYTHHDNMYCYKKEVIFQPHR